MSVTAELPTDPLAHAKNDSTPTANEGADQKTVNVKAENSEELDMLEPAEKAQDPDESKDQKPVIEGVDENDRLEVIRQIEFYFSDANLPYDKFMFLSTSPHLDPLKAPQLSPEAKKKAEEYGPGCSPVLLQTVASFKRMRPFSTKYPTSKLAQILKTSSTDPKLLEVTTEELDGKPTLYVRRLLKLNESSRAGASDRCVYVKGFLTEQDLAKPEPADMQVQLEKWARSWGPVAVLRMRREFDGKGAPKNIPKSDKKWKNSVFIEYDRPASAEKLVYDFKQEIGKPKFNGRELSSIMFKIDYVTMKAKEKGLPPPKMDGKRQAGQPASGSFGGNNSTFNAFKEIKAIAAGSKQFAGVPATEQIRVIEYEGNQLHVNKDGSLKNPEELKTYRPNMALGFDLEGDAPENFYDARVNFSSLKKELTDDGIVCNVVHLASDDKSKGTVGFDQPISDEKLEKLQAKGVQAGGRPLKLRRLNEEEVKKFHLDCATLRAKSTHGPKDNKQNGHQRNNGRDKENRRGGGRGGRDGPTGKRRGDRGRDRNAEKAANPNDQGGEENNNKSPVVAGNKRDAEGNVISTNGSPANGGSKESVPEIGRAEKKPKTSA